MRVRDILECIGKIERHTQGLSYSGFEEDEKTIDAVFSTVEIMGEAAHCTSAGCSVTPIPDRGEGIVYARILESCAGISSNSKISTHDCRFSRE